MKTTPKLLFAGLILGWLAVIATQSLPAQTKLPSSHPDKQYRSFMEICTQPSGHDEKIILHRISEDLGMDHLTYKEHEIFKRILYYFKATPDICRQLKKKLPLVKRLKSLGRVSDLGLLRWLKNLERLELTLESEQDLPLVSKLVELKHLNIGTRSWVLKTLDDLVPLKNLEVLILNSGHIKNLSKLKNFPKLKRLELEKNTGFGDDDTELDLTPLHSSKDLEYLNLRWSNVRNISVLSNLKKLNYLNLSDNEIKDITPLKNLKQLRYLFLKGNIVYKIEALEGLIGLEELDVGYAGLSTLCPVKNLFRLKILKAARNSRLSEVCSLHKLKDLTYLDLNETDIVDIGFLSKLKNLKTLKLAEAQVVDLTPLQHMKKLERLELYINEIRDMTPVVNFPKLKVLQLQKNKIRLLPSLKGLPSIEYLSLNNNLIQDTSAVSELPATVKVIIYGNPSGKGDEIKLEDYCTAIDVYNKKCTPAEHRRQQRELKARMRKMMENQ